MSLPSKTPQPDGPEGSPFWRCPTGGEPLARDLDGRTWSCPAGHVFDIAREGYVNLLTTHQRRSREPGDSPEMVRRRRSFLDAGHYRILSDAVVDLLAAHLPPADDGRRHLVDVGCGEGYYSRRWPDDLGAVVAAVDIAKAAVKAAARRGAEPGLREYAVASAYALPLEDGWAGGAVSIFSPIETGELDRVLRPGGLVVTATPGPRHLWQLKERAFDIPEEHPPDPPLPEPVEVRRLTGEIHLSGPGAAGDLLGMTPYVWYLDPERVAAIEALDSLTTEIDFLVAVHRRGLR